MVKSNVRDEGCSVVLIATESLAHAMVRSTGCWLEDNESPKQGLDRPEMMEIVDMMWITDISITNSWTSVQ